LITYGADEHRSPGNALVPNDGFKLQEFNSLILINKPSHLSIGNLASKLKTLLHFAHPPLDEFALSSGY